MILIKDRHAFGASHFKLLHNGKYDTYKGSTHHYRPRLLDHPSGKYDTYKGSTPVFIWRKFISFLREI